MRNVTSRRRLLQMGIALAATTAGCTVEEESAGTDIQDSDGDGVIDSEDYAPNDPDVQRKSDVTAGTETQNARDDTPTPTATDTPTETPTETPPATPPEDFTYPSHSGTHRITARDNYWAWEFSAPVEPVLEYQVTNLRDENYDFDVLLYTPSKFERYRAIATEVEEGIRPQYLDGSAPGVEAGARGFAQLPPGRYYLVIDNTDLSDAGDWGTEDTRHVRLNASTRPVETGLTTTTE